MSQVHNVTHVPVHSPPLAALAVAVALGFSGSEAAVGLEQARQMGFQRGAGGPLLYPTGPLRPMRGANIDAERNAVPVIEDQKITRACYALSGSNPLLKECL